MEGRSPVRRPATMAFCSSVPVNLRDQLKRQTTLVCRASSGKRPPAPRIPRREALRSAAAAALGLAFGSGGRAGRTAEKAGPPPTSEKPATGVLTKSGLKYFDFEEGAGARPQWGDYVRVQYVAYTISPDGLSLRKEDSTYGRNDGAGFLIHHGNGEMMLGLEEALHSMAVGGRRRVIIPPQLAYNDIDIGPVPVTSWTRRKFSKHLSEGDGTVVFDVELLSVAPDPDNRGFYDDLTPTDMEFREIAIKAREEYAQELRKQGLEPPDPSEPISEFQLDVPDGEPARSIVSFGPPVGTSIE